MIKVSIIVAAYNIENYIGRCIESLIKQTFKDIEIIIVNDGSTDATLKRIKDKANEDSRISVINQENKGLIEARKIGLANAKGKYILFVDGDDWLEVNTIEKLYFNATEINADIVLYNSIWADDDGIVKKQITYSQEESFKDDYIKMFLLGKLSVNIWSKFIKKEFLQGIEFESNISYGEDLITVIKLLINKPKIAYLNEYLYYYYQRDGAITKVINSKVFELEKSINLVKDYLIKYDLYNKYKLEYEYFCFINLYLFKIIYNKQIDKIHKKLYLNYKKRKINMFTNKYIRKYILTLDNNIKFKIFIYNINYFMVVLYNKIRNK